MKSSHPQFVILTPIHNINRNVRDKELEDAIVRSHAAKVTHKRRKVARLLLLEQSIQQGRAPRTSQSSFQTAYGSHKISIRHPKRRPLQPEPQFIGRHDPFATYVGHSVSAICLQALDYARETVFTPIWAPFRCKEVSSLEVAWKQAAVHHAFIFHAELANSINWTMLKFVESNSYTKELEVIQAQHRGLALQALRQEIESPTSQPSALHVHAIGLLAFASGPEVDYTEPYPLSPMGDLQQVYAVSRCKTTLAHVNALYDTVALNGGIAKMGALALAHTLEFTDLCISTHLGQTPRFPLLRPGRGNPSSPSIQASQPGIGIEGLGVIQPINTQLYEILSEMLRLTNLVDLYHHQDPNPLTNPLVQALVQRRNEVQHDLLSFRPLPTPPAATNQGAQTSEQSSSANYITVLAELIRLAALIYSDMVLFPTAWISGIKPRLAQQIHDVAQASQIFDPTAAAAAAESAAGDPVWLHPHADLQVWILTFGCFAAYQSDLQGWFEERLGSMLETVYGSRVRRKGTGGVDFEEARHGLWRFLWWGPVCDKPGKALWERIVARIGARV